MFIGYPLIIRQSRQLSYMHAVSKGLNQLMVAGQQEEAMLSQMIPIH